MPSTYTQAGLEHQADGENDTTWGGKVNNIISMLDQLSGGVVEIAMATGGVTMAFTNGATDENSRDLVIGLTSGTAAAVATMVVPAMQRAWLIRNDAKNAVAIRTSTGSAITLPSGVDAVIYAASNTLNFALNDAYFPRVEVATGTLAAPSISFAGDPDTGWFATAANTMAFGVGGKQILSLASDEIVTTGNLTVAGLTASSITLGGTLSVASGSAAAPGITFGDANTGIFATVANTLAISAGGKQILSFASDEIVSSGNLTIAGLTASTLALNSPLDLTSGSAAAPALTFGDTNTGFYATAANSFNVGVNGKQVVQFTSKAILALDGIVIISASGAVNKVGLGINATDTGFFATAVDTFGIACNGVHIVKFSTNSITLQGNENLHIDAGGQIGIDKGTIAAPGFSFTTNLDTGMCMIADGKIRFVIDGQTVAIISASGIQTTVGALTT